MSQEWKTLPSHTFNLPHHPLTCPISNFQILKSLTISAEKAPPGVPQRNVQRPRIFLFFFPHPRYVPAVGPFPKRVLHLSWILSLLLPSHVPAPGTLPQAHTAQLSQPLPQPFFLFYPGLQSGQDFKNGIPERFLSAHNGKRSRMH